jgi:hypothetical protein
LFSHSRIGFGSVFKMVMVSESGMSPVRKRKRIEEQKNIVLGEVEVAFIDV